MVPTPKGTEGQGGGGMMLNRVRGYFSVEEEGGGRERGRKV